MNVNLLIHHTAFSLCQILSFLKFLVVLKDFLGRVPVVVSTLAIQRCSADTFQVLFLKLRL